MIYEVKVPSTKRGHRPDGVLIMLPLGVAPIVKKVLIPKDKAIEARAMAIRVARGHYDLCLCTVYCPLGARGRDGNKQQADRKTMDLDSQGPRDSASQVYYDRGH